MLTRISPVAAELVSAALAEGAPRNRVAQAPNARVHTNGRLFFLNTAKLPTLCRRAKRNRHLRARAGESHRVSQAEPNGTFCAEPWLLDSMRGLNTGSSSAFSPREHRRSNRFSASLSGGTDYLAAPSLVFPHRAARIDRNPRRRPPLYAGADLNRRASRIRRSIAVFIPNSEAHPQSIALHPGAKQLPPVGWLVSRSTGGNFLELRIRSAATGLRPGSPDGHAFAQRQGSTLQLLRTTRPEQPPGSSYLRCQ